MAAPSKIINKYPGFITNAIKLWQPSTGTNDGSTLYILSPIGYDGVTGDGITAKSVADYLDARDSNEPLNVKINSPGGEVFEGISIYNLLCQYPAPVNVEIVGIAASAASIIAMAGDTVRMAPASMIMIHNASLLAYGDKQSFYKVINALAPVDAAIGEIYAKKTGISVEKIASYMDETKYFSANESVSQGFADALSDIDGPVPASNKLDLANSADRKLDYILASSGLSRKERRELISNIKGTPSAAASATPSAGDTTETNLFDGLIIDTGILS